MGRQKNATTIPPDAKSERTRGGGGGDPFFATVCVDHYLLIRVQQSDDDTTALTALASLASDHVRLFRPGETGIMPILAPKNSTDWDPTIDALGFIINSHTMRTSFDTRKNRSD